MNKVPSTPNDRSVTAWLMVGPSPNNRDIDRAGLVLRSLDHYWTGDEPLAVRVTYADQLASEIQDLVEIKLSNLNVQWGSDSELIGKESVHRIADSGWYRHQLVRILGASSVSQGAILLLDTDCYATNYFDEFAFFHEGRIINSWELRENKEWWSLSERLFKTQGRKDVYGMMNSPNMWCGSLVNQINNNMRVNYGDLLAYLSGILTVNQLQGINPFTEISYYNLGAEKLNLLDSFHVSPQEKQTKYCECNVWTAEDLDSIKRVDGVIKAPFRIIHGELDYSTELIEKMLFLKS